jgi:hypothetical protein
MSARFGKPVAIYLTQTMRSRALRRKAEKLASAGARPGEQASAQASAQPDEQPGVRAE